MIIFGKDIQSYNTYEEYLKSINEFSLGRTVMKTPHAIIVLYRELAKQLRTYSAYIPVFNLGDLSYALTKSGVRTVSHIQSESEKAIAERFLFEQYSLGSKEKYRFICADVPFFGQIKEHLLPTMDRIYDTISENGYVALTFPASVPYDKQYKSVLEYAEEKGLYVDAVIDLPKKTYAPTTNIETKVLVFRNKPSARRFIARIEKESDIEAVVSNYVNNIGAKNYTIGAWIDKSEFFDLHSFEAELTYRKMVKNYGGKAFTIRELAFAVNLPKRDKGFNDILGSIYVPKVGVSPVIDNLENLNIKTQNYIQIVLNEDLLSTQYACFFLNSERGILSRKMMMNGFIPTFNLQTIQNLVIILPEDKEEQNKILETYKQIDDLKIQIGLLENKFFSRPVEYKQIQKSIRDINNSETLNDWVETLPFPLASILRRYLIENSFEKKQEILLLFFEAYAIFVSCILLSVINENIMEIQCDNVFETTDIKYFSISTFGSWVTLNKIITNYLLGKKVGSNPEEKKELLKGYFKTDNDNLIDVICNKDINAILSNACGKRNKWKGHTGISSPEICKEHVIELERYLNQLRQIVKDSFLEMELIRSTSCVITRSGTENNIEKLTGSNMLFMKESFETATPLVSGVLYIKMNDTQRVIELLPLIVFKKSPSNEKNACYFYSRNEDDKTTYVSYHYESEPEESEPGHEALEALTKIIKK